MKKSIYFLFASLIVMLAFMTACLEEQVEVLIEDPAERLQGTWTIQKMYVAGLSASGDGSTITFNACGDVDCSGCDYVASEDVTCDFVYNLTETHLAIEYPGDTGDFNGNWTIDKFTNDEIKISMSVFGIDMYYILTK